jgi:hypothetical protein
MLSNLVDRLGGTGTGFAPILIRRRKKELSVIQSMQSIRVVISMEPRKRFARSPRARDRSLKQSQYFPVTPLTCLFKIALFCRFLIGD